MPFRMRAPIPQVLWIWAAKPSQLLPSLKNCPQLKGSQPTQEITPPPVVASSRWLIDTGAQKAGPLPPRREQFWDGLPESMMQNSCGAILNPSLSGHPALVSLLPPCPSSSLPSSRGHSFNKPRACTPGPVSGSASRECDPRQWESDSL